MGRSLTSTMINLLILWGDYDTVPALAIYQIVHGECEIYVTLLLCLNEI